MPKLPNLSGSKCAAALEKAGFRQVRRARSTHFYMRRDDPFAVVSVPDHRELDKGTLRAIIREAGLTVDEFVKLL
jgi:predicted RNA binding protein YcfA (HicA-like mRNA interferase family)